MQDLSFNSAAGKRVFDDIAAAGKQRRLADHQASADGTGDQHEDVRVHDL
jgi:hypothetical protein